MGHMNSANPPATASSANVPVLDPEAIEALRSLSPDDGDTFLREIAGIFLEDTPQRIAELDRCFASGDLPTLIRAAHSIKGSSSNIGATGLRAAAATTEQRAHVAGLANLEPHLAEIKAEFARAQAALKALLGS
jgi:histidine phosphotransfer protein HptB